MVRINILSRPMMAPSDSDFLGGGGSGPPVCPLGLRMLAFCWRADIAPFLHVHWDTHKDKLNGKG